MISVKHHDMKLTWFAVTVYVLYHYIPYVENLYAFKMQKTYIKYSKKYCCFNL